MPSFSAFRPRFCFTSLQLAHQHLQRATQLFSSQKREDVDTALLPLEAALELCPQWDKAMELKARALLYLKRFREVVEMLHDYIPSYLPQSVVPESPVAREKTRLLSDYAPDEQVDEAPILKYFSVAKLRKKLSARLSKRSEERQWIYLVLGQACFHLGMMEDAIILLQNGKRTASAASRRQSNCLRDDNFCSDRMTAAESDLVNQMLGNIKLLMRRRSAALVALEAGQYSESVRHFSKIVEGRKGVPLAFLADCYLHRAIAYQATGRVIEAIADCNRTLALSPNCTTALSVRASLFEMVQCFSECLLDLQQLKMIYEAGLRYRMMPEPHWTIRQQNTSGIDFAGGLEYINSKITTTRQRISGGRSIDAHTILDLPRNCTMADVERAYLLISLKHKPDKAAQFVEGCHFMYGRDITTVKEEARASALRLSQLIQKAYTGLLSSIVDKETQRKKDLKMARSDVVFGRNVSDNKCVGSLHEDCSSSLEGEEATVNWEGGSLGQEQRLKWGGDGDERRSNSWFEEDNKTEEVMLEALRGLNLCSERPCKTVVDVGAIISQALCPDRANTISSHQSHQTMSWMNSLVTSSCPLPVT